MSLEDLPLELLAIVARQIKLSDVPSFALTNSTFHQLSQPRLQECRFVRKRLRNIDLNREDQDGFYTTTAHLASMLTQDPGLGAWIETLDMTKFDYFGDIDDFEYPCSSLDAYEYTQPSKKYMEFVQRYLATRDAALPEWTLDAVGHGCNGLALYGVYQIFLLHLLSLLPNARALRLPSLEEALSFIPVHLHLKDNPPLTASWLHSIVDSARLAVKDGRVASLARLTHLEIHELHEQDSCILLKLPSLTDLGHECCNQVLERAEPLDTVTSLVLGSGGLLDAPLRHTFALFPHLQRLQIGRDAQQSYDVAHEYESDGLLFTDEDLECTAHSIAMALRNSDSKALETLLLDVDRAGYLCFESGFQAETVYGPYTRLSFNHMSNLRYLALTTTSICKFALPLCSEQEAVERGYDSLLTTGHETLWEVQDSQRGLLLHDLFPRCLEVLALIETFEDDSMVVIKALFTDFSRHRHLLPKLHTINICSEDNCALDQLFDIDLGEELNDTGLTLSLFDRDVYCQAELLEERLEAHPEANAVYEDSDFDDSGYGDS